ncbi:MAG TPA: GNAT family N-acetyltransferase [Alphaproteobacteria bacterium]
MGNEIFHIVPMTEDHVVGWRRLWRKNVNDALDNEVLDHTQTQILDPREPLFALLAVSETKEVVALLHGVVHPVAGSVNPVCYMQDLYVHPAKRRQGIATRLLDALRAMGMSQKWDRIYWLTEQGNSEAHAFYEDKSVALDFTFHILPLGMLEKLKD